MTKIVFLKDVRNRWTDNILYKQGDVCSTLNDKQITKLYDAKLCSLDEKKETVVKEVLTTEVLSTETILPEVNKPLANEEVISYANTHNIDLSTVKGSGKDGRILLKDIKNL